MGKEYHSLFQRTVDIIVYHQNSGTGALQLSISRQFISSTLRTGLFLWHFRLLLRRSPAQTRSVDGDRWPLVLCAVHQVVDDLRRNADDLLTFPVADEVQRLQRNDDVVRRDACHVTENGRQTSVTN